MIFQRKMSGLMLAALIFTAQAPFAYAAEGTTPAPQPMAPAAAPDAPKSDLGRIVCKAPPPVTGTLVARHRVCKTEREWEGLEDKDHDPPNASAPSADHQ